MGITELLTALKAVIKKCVEGMALEVNPDTGEYEEDHNLPLEPADQWGTPELPEDSPEYGENGKSEQARQTEGKRRPPGVYLMNLPERSDWISRVPYILIQFLSSKDKYDKEDKDDQATADIRVLIAVYCQDGEDGGLQVLEIIERIRVMLQSGMLLDGNYMLIKPFDAEVYPDDTGNYFLGEINMTWSVPTIQRTALCIEDVKAERAQRKENE